jgi:hypothetical protein
MLLTRQPAPQPPSAPLRPAEVVQRDREREKRGSVRRYRKLCAARCTSMRTRVQQRPLECSGGESCQDTASGLESMVYGLWFPPAPSAWPLGRASPPPDTGFTWLLLLQTQGLGLGRELTEDTRAGETERAQPSEVGGGGGLHWEGCLLPADQARHVTANSSQRPGPARSETASARMMQTCRRTAGRAG